MAAHQCLLASNTYRYLVTCNMMMGRRRGGWLSALAPHPFLKNSSQPLVLNTACKHTQLSFFYFPFYRGTMVSVSLEIRLPLVAPGSKCKYLMQLVVMTVWLHWQATSGHCIWMVRQPRTGQGM